MTLKTPWTLIDPTDDGAGILARIVTDAEMGHVAVFESPETARATVETMNRAESAEQERRELERELAETRALAKGREKRHEETTTIATRWEQDCILCKYDLDVERAELAETRAKLAASEHRWLERGFVKTPAEQAVLDAMAAFGQNELALMLNSRDRKLVVLAEAELARRGDKP